MGCVYIKLQSLVDLPSVLFDPHEYILYFITSHCWMQKLKLVEGLGLKRQNKTLVSGRKFQTHMERFLDLLRVTIRQCTTYLKFLHCWGLHAEVSPLLMLTHLPPEKRGVDKGSERLS